MKSFVVVKILGFVIFGLLVASCIFEETPELNVPDNVSFSAHIVPIFESSCNSATCHDSRGANPNLSPEAAWNSLQSNYLNLKKPESSLLITKMDGGSMAPYSTDQEIGLIIAWIKDGAQNN